jgi:alcohol dehydrogenase (cytochrome c)
MTRFNLRALAVAVALAFPIRVTMQQAADDYRSPAAVAWSTIGGDWANTRHSMLARITTENVNALGGAWMSQKLDPVAASRSTPVVQHGLMFVTAGPRVYALNAKTGEMVWSYRSGATPLPSSGAQASQGNPAREGVAVGEGLVFVGMSDAHVIALREKTGELVWSQYIGDTPRHRGQGVSGAPTYAGGMVFTGLNADFGLRGRVVALDAQTGRQAWEFYVVPGPGEPGHETWPRNSDSWKHGGGAIWLVGAADPDLGLIYYGTGNGVPQYGGDVRAGDNLYLCSLVALDMKTGKLRWYYQVIRHDIWEADIAVAPVLFNTIINGRARRGIAAMRVDGFLFMLDRETGKPLMPVEDRPVPQDAFQRTAATQPFPVGTERVLPDCDEWRKQTIPVGFEMGCFFTPATPKRPNLLVPFVGMRSTPMAFSPDTGFFYASGAARLDWFRRAENPYYFSLGNQVPGLGSGYRVLAAIDSRTNRIAWRKEFRVGSPGGAMTTAGGLMFQSAGDGNFEAYNARTGERLWQFQTGSLGGGPPATYEIDGEQYVTVVAASNVWAFKLAGSLRPQPAPAPPKEELFTGPIQEVSLIETASLGHDTGLTGNHYMLDEYVFSPRRARVKVGTEVTWQNNGTMTHTVMAQDGSWATGPLSPLAVATIKFDKPGSYTYVCRDHPWAIGQLIVE